MIMTGDLHNSLAVKITDRVWEFASGPLGSQNHPARSEGGRPPNGEFDSRGRKVDIRWSSLHPRRHAGFAAKDALLRRRAGEQRVQQSSWSPARPAGWPTRGRTW